ncbi:MAG: hypothetical protein OXU64_12690 [Gemmatimonadota bacterium]|nr:hypothetical protein [Gemmatimonadota bacterium]
MSLTKEDLKRIGDLIVASEERVYSRIKDKALSEITKRLDSISEDLGTMAEDVAKITVIEGEIRLMDENIQALRDHAGI